MRWRTASVEVGIEGRGCGCGGVVRHADRTRRATLPGTLTARTHGFARLRVAEGDPHVLRARGVGVGQQGAEPEARRLRRRGKDGTRARSSRRGELAVDDSPSRPRRSRLTFSDPLVPRRALGLRFGSVLPAVLCAAPDLLCLLPSFRPSVLHRGAKRRGSFQGGDAASDHSHGTTARGDLEPIHHGLG